MIDPLSLASAIEFVFDVPTDDNSENPTISGPAS